MRSCADTSTRQETLPRHKRMVGFTLGLTAFFCLWCSSPTQARHLVDQPVAANSKLGPHPLDRPSLLERAGLQIASARTGAERWGTPPAEALAARAEALRARACLQAEAEAGRAAVRLAFAEPIFRSASRIESGSALRLIGLRVDRGLRATSVAYFPIVVTGLRRSRSCVMMRSCPVGHGVARTH